MGSRRGGGKGRGGANGAAAAGAKPRDEEEAGALTNAAAAEASLDEREQVQQPLLAPPPPPPPPPRASGPKRGSSSSCFLADGILAADGDGDGATANGGETTGERGGRHAAAAAGGERAAAERARQHSKTQRRLAVAVALASFFMVAEVVGGALANSLAIMSDAAHLLSDVAGMGIALAAGAAAARKALPGSAHTFGHHRAEVIGALGSTAATWAVTAALVVAAVGRLRRPEPVDGKVMFLMAVLGVLVNVLLLLVLGGAHGGHGHGAGGHSHSHSHGEGHSHCHGEEGHHHHHDDGDDDEETAPHAAASSINLRGAVLHAVGDLLQSVGVAVAGAVVYFRPSWTVADPLVTLLFAGIVFATTRGIAGELLSILMEAAPARVDVSALEQSLLRVEGVTSVADLHVWGLSGSLAIAAAHLAVDPAAAASRRRREGVLAAARRAMEAHGVAHSTVQVEEEGEGEEV